MVPQNRFRLGSTIESNLVSLPSRPVESPSTSTAMAISTSYSEMISVGTRCGGGRIHLQTSTPRSAGHDEQSKTTAATCITTWSRQILTATARQS